MSHWGVAWGLPIRPVGRWTVTFLASSQAQGSSGAVWWLPSDEGEGEIGVAAGLGGGGDGGELK